MKSKHPRINLQEEREDEAAAIEECSKSIEVAHDMMEFVEKSLDEDNSGKVEFMSLLAEKGKLNLEEARKEIND